MAVDKRRIQYRLLVMQFCSQYTVPKRRATIGCHDKEQGILSVLCQANLERIPGAKEAGHGIPHGPHLNQTLFLQQCPKLIEVVAREAWLGAIDRREEWAL